MLLFYDNISFLLFWKPVVVRWNSRQKSNLTRIFSGDNPFSCPIRE